MGEVAQHVEVLGVHMTVEQYRRCEILLENIRADLNVIAEQSCTIIERLDRFLSKLERFERTEPKVDRLEPSRRNVRSRGRRSAVSAA